MALFLSLWSFFSTDFTQSFSGCLKVFYVVFAFGSALCLGALKGLFVGPISALILILGNVGIILGLFPAHVAWTIYTLIKIDRFDAPLKVAILFALPGLLAIWLGLSIAGSVLGGVGYGFFTPWVATFEAFRHDNEFKKFKHCIVDGTWGTVKGSCTVVRDFGDLCYHSYSIYLKELRESPASEEVQPLRLIHIPACIIAGVLGLMVEIPVYTAIAVVKSPYMLFKGWYRLIHDLISREGPFLELACVPIAGLTILLWPIVVVASIVLAVFSSIFIALYAPVIVYQERSFRKGVAYVIAMVAEFDEYTNDWLYLREGTIFPKPKYRKRTVSQSSELSVRGNQVAGGKFSPASMEAPAMLMPTIAHSRSVRSVIQEVKMVQIWENMMRSCQLRGKQLLDANTLLCSIRSNSSGLLLLDDVEINHFNRPHDKLLDWFFNPIMVLKEQIKVQLAEGEVRFLEKVVLFGGNTQRMEAWDNGSLAPQDALRAAQIEGISRRMIGMMRSVSKFPTYRRRFRLVVKALMAHSVQNEASHICISVKSSTSNEDVLEEP
ncbi:putative membrane protein [Prunus yedoensis var. nudiflora]|uniref:Putative membrane protein n=1 Tax=Prunus yedoensis var. nudiflora TaxID=2094558 RepID=A0A314YMM9_PRUYE|nr:putative membrane protein [Prunus yedoensis var. nudiflora]